MKAQWTRFPENWKGVDPCGNNWVGISCYNNKVVSISLGNLNVEGKLGESISALSELYILFCRIASHESSVDKVP
ncbi:hypothetical protein F2Q68_00000305 [Brassica cretica]|uniref:Leucine-rich repeat-containing N-terminal plant-type domain-containing protein n=1 Tax=Brassica cretica TaxID=69181 RepID=A0A8S9JK23_BRACR|nr:hypothetical protein F2Q68_00000305 [Brassica cretica]